MKKFLSSILTAAYLITTNSNAMDEYYLVSLSNATSAEVNLNSSFSTDPSSEEAASDGTEDLASLIDSESTFQEDSNADSSEGIIDEVLLSSQSFIPLSGRDVLDFLNNHNITGSQAFDFVNRHLMQVLAHVGKFDLANIQACAQALIESGADMNAFIINVPGLNFARGFSAFYIAILTGSCQLIKFLLEKGARIDQTNSGYYTPLMVAMLAAQRRDKHVLPVVQLLVEHGACINGLSTRKDSALGYACRAQASKTILYLIENGASVSKLTQENIEIVKKYIPNTLERIALTGKAELLQVFTRDEIVEGLLYTRALFYAATQAHVNLVSAFIGYLQQRQPSIVRNQRCTQLAEEAITQTTLILSRQSPYLFEKEKVLYATSIQLLRNFLPTCFPYQQSSPGFARANSSSSQNLIGLTRTSAQASTANSYEILINLSS